MSSDDGFQRPRSGFLAKLLFLLLAVGAGAVGAVAISRSDLLGAKPEKDDTYQADETPKNDWVAAAPGRIEPKSGFVRIGAELPARIAEIPVKLNDVVEEGELLIRLDDDEARARLQAAETEAASRKRERDAQPLDKARDDLRTAEDNVFAAERALTNSRFELEYELQAKRQGTGNADRVSEARRNVTKAKSKLQKERANYASAQAKPDVPAPNRLESALQAARSDVAVAEAVLEKTRIRAPLNGKVLQLSAKAGEMVSPSPDQVLIVLGDMSVVRLKAEVNEIDAAKIHKGDKVVVKSNAQPDKEFTGVVSEKAPSLTSPNFALRSARRPNDVQILEVTVDLDGNPTDLLPGMRADAFFK